MQPEPLVDSALPSLEPYPAIEEFLGNYKQRAAVRMHRLRYAGYFAIPLAWLLWRWLSSDDWIRNGILLVGYLQMFVIWSVNLGRAKKLAGNVLADYEEFDKVLRSTVPDGEEETFLKAIDDDLKEGYICIQGFYLTKSWLIRLDVDAAVALYNNDNLNPPFEPIILIKLDEIGRIGRQNFFTEKVASISGGGRYKVFLELGKNRHYPLAYRFQFPNAARREEFLNALLERNPAIEVV